MLARGMTKHATGRIVLRTAFRTAIRTDNVLFFSFLCKNINYPLGIGRDLNHPHTNREVSACLDQYLYHITLFIK
mgnify:CR=1 FL=1